MTNTESDLAQLTERLDRIERFGDRQPRLVDPPLPKEGTWQWRKMEADRVAREARLRAAKLEDERRQADYAKRAPQRAKAAAELQRVSAKLANVESERGELLAQMHRLEREANR